MSDLAIKVENISKLYQIGIAKKGSLRETIMYGLNKLTSKVDEQTVAKEFWALKDISFEIKKGDAVGIIGRNGAGKSTLLKTLSRITKPTTGKITINGRVASLLEVGTGFHPELTGRENIFMNGAILGMKQSEIKRKFDDIVEFSGIEKFVDTPVKRYSSGMYVRLAFAVAAHLEPEILIVDEVLAVGDLEFQKKCLGKMNDVSQREGRTVLFVSHSMTAITNLCKSGIMMDKGKINFIGDVDQAVSSYLQRQDLTMATAHLDPSNPRQSHWGMRRFLELTSIELLNQLGAPTSEVRIGDPVKVKIEFQAKTDCKRVEIGFVIVNNLGSPLTGFVSTWEGFQGNFEKNNHCVICEIPALNLLPNTYSITPWIKEQGQGVDHEVNMALDFQVIGQDITGYNPYFENYNHLGMFQRSKWGQQKSEFMTI
jgi:lipopolysaccharide transport system ATP-binding protein